MNGRILTCESIIDTVLTSEVTLAVSESYSKSSIVRECMHELFM